jgi:hypothetical protein
LPKKKATPKAWPVVLEWIDQEPAPVNPDGAILSSNSSILKITRYTPFRNFDV